VYTKDERAAVWATLGLGIAAISAAIYILGMEAF